MSDILICVPCECVQFKRKENGELSIFIGNLEIRQKDFWGTGDNKKSLNDFLNEHCNEMMYESKDLVCRIITKVKCITKSINPYKSKGLQFNTKDVK